MLLCAAARDLVHSKKLQIWDPINFILILPSLVKEDILYWQAYASELLKIFAKNVVGHWTEI